MSISFIVSGVGAVVAAIGLGLILARCLRAPRGDLIAWSVALLSLVISLVAQALGHLSGFGSVSFRVMEIGAALLAPFALILGLAELVSRGVAGRFAARLFISALAFVALVIMATDPLSGAAFTKAWPSPATYYQFIPNKLLEYGLAPVPIVVAVILVIVVAVRAGRPGQWRAVLPAAAAAGLATIALAVPGLAPALSAHFGLTLPLRSLFAVLCLIAALLTWFAGVSAARLPVAALRGAGDAGVPGRRAGTRRRSAVPAGAGHEDDEYDGAAERDGWGHGPRWEGDQTGDFQAGDYQTGDFQTGDFQTGDFQTGDFQTGDFDSYDDGSQGVYRGGGLYRDEPPGVRTAKADGAGPGWQSRTGDYDSRELDSREIAAAYGPGSPGTRVRDGDRNGHAAGSPAGRADAARAQLFGQIAIYTLIEDRVGEFDKLAERVVAKVRASEPATLVFIVHAVPSAPMQRILYEVYRDRAAFDQHERQPHAIEFEAARRPYVLATNVIELGLQQAAVSPFPSISELFGEPGYDTSGFERPDYTREYGSSTGQNDVVR
jgi:quinol monooxygenase YgiN